MICVSTGASQALSAIYQCRVAARVYWPARFLDANKPQALVGSIKQMQGQGGLSTNPKLHCIQLCKHIVCVCAV